MELQVFNEEGKVVEKLSFDEAVFGTIVKKRLLSEIVALYEANKRQGNASTRNRWEVVGSTRKLWKQKGTGRARTSGIRNPIWKGGGKTFGPKPRSFKTDIPVKMRRAARDSALLSKFRDDEVLVLDAFSFEKPLTKRMAAIFSKLGIDGSCLVVTRERDENVLKSARNIPGAEVMRLGDLNAYDVLRKKKMLVTKEIIGEFASKKRNGGK